MVKGQLQFHGVTQQINFNAKQFSLDDNLIFEGSFPIMLEDFKVKRPSLLFVKAENKIQKFINEIKQEFNLTNDKICLVGFSQGCMLSLNVGLISKEKFSCIVGFSGKIIDQNNLKIQI